MEYDYPNVCSKCYTFKYCRKDGDVFVCIRCDEVNDITEKTDFGGFK